MAKKKSLGSSPIGYSRLGMSSFHFIPDLGISNRKKESEEKPSEDSGSGREKTLVVKEKSPPEKKIVSYYLEKQLVKRLKVFAKEQNMYYSAVVSDALEYWIEDHGY
ncbi:MAG: hypothetical protein R3211_07740 [Balneolaceae bacterium]|nr:hypothetical protein [Balneolaceae bacterium]